MPRQRTPRMPLEDRITVEALVAPAATTVVMLGAAGSGKTVLLNQIATWATQHGHRVLRIAFFPTPTRHPSAQQDVHHIGVRGRINPLDIVFDATTAGGWRACQRAHARGLLAYFLGRPTISAAGREVMEPRIFTRAEQALLEQALDTLYCACTPEMPPEAMPTLTQLIAALDAQHKPESAALARALRLVLGDARAAGHSASASVGAIFDGVTTVDWDIYVADTAYDLSAVPDLWWPVCMTHVLGSARSVAHMLLPRLRGRQRQRRTYLLVEEFGALARLAVGGQLAVELAEFSHDATLSLLAADQDPRTFVDDAYGRRIWEHAAAKILLHQDTRAARRVADLVNALQPEHLHALSTSTPGHGLVVRGDVVSPLAVELDMHERHARRDTREGVGR